MSHDAISNILSFDKRWIKSRVQEELQQAVHYAEMQPVPHWSVDQHEHRQEFTRIIHEATEGVSATTVRPRKLYVTDAILEVSAHRASLIKTKRREEQQVKRLDGKRIFAVWKEVTHWIAGHKRPTDVALISFGAFRSKTTQYERWHQHLPKALEASTASGCQSRKSTDCPEGPPTHPKSQSRRGSPERFG